VPAQWTIEPLANLIQGGVGAEPLGDAVDFGAIEVHVSNLRRRIGVERIRTVRGVGYMLVP
jgi:two-component system, OmpR family, response regulator QseB